MIYLEAAGGTVQGDILQTQSCSWVLWKLVCCWSETLWRPGLIVPVRLPVMQNTAWKISWIISTLKCG